MGPVWFQRTKWHGADESCCPTSLRMIHGSNRVVFVLEKHCMEPAMCRERLPLFFTFQIINVIKKRHSMWDHSVMYLVKESQSTWPQFLNPDLSASCTAAKQSHRIRTRELISGWNVQPVTCCFSDSSREEMFIDFSQGELDLLHSLQHFVVPWLCLSLSKLTEE